MVKAGAAMLALGVLASRPGLAAGLPVRARASTVRRLPAAGVDRVAAVQARAAGAWSTASLARTLRRAARAGATLVVLPEVARPAAAEAIPGAATQSLARLATAARVTLAAPLREAAPGGYYATLALVDARGRLLGSARKRTPRLDGGDGPALVRAGAKEPLDSIDVGGARLGLVAGEDLRLGVPRLAERGAHLILVSAAWDARAAPAYEALCRELTRAHRVTLAVASVAGGGIYRDGERLGERGEVVAGAGLVLATVPRPDVALPAPLGLPTPPVPVDRALTPASVALGRALFFDAGLSRDGRLSCAGCHAPEHAFADGARFARGVDGRPSARNVPSLLNVAYRESLFWDGSSASLEHLAKFPMTHVSEMDFHYLDVVRAVAADPWYAAALRALNGDRAVEFDDLARALADYQRTLVSGASPFDAYYYGGERGALSAAAVRGLGLFQGRAGCAACHAMGSTSALFSDGRAHNTGVGWRGGFSDLGRGALDEGADGAGFFMTPSLRNVAVTAPYMHDGSLRTLDEVVAFYDRGGGANPGLDARLHPLGLDAGERHDLVELLRALTGRPPAALATRYAALAPVDAAMVKPLASAAGSPADGAAMVKPLGAAMAAAAAAGARVLVLDARAPAASVEALVATLGREARARHLWIAAPVAAPHGGPPALALVDERGALAALGPGGAREPTSAATPYGRVGLLNGAELAAGLPRLAAAGAQVILVSAAWPPADAPGLRALAAELGARHHVDVVIANADATPALAVTEVAARAVAMAPLGLPAPPAPGAAASDGCVALGRELFFDPGLSRDGQTSCATCHRPEHAFSDGRKLAQGVAGRAGHFNVPALGNVAYRTHLFWDGRADSLEAQVSHALFGWAELDSSAAAATRYLEHNPRYAGLGAVADGSGSTDGGSLDAAVRCLAGFERTLVAGDSAFDRYYYAGEHDALSPAAARGFALFVGKANCQRCHQVGARAALFTDNRQHNTGVGYHRRFEYLGYGGDGLDGNLATHNSFHGEWVTPGLRDVARTAPYMHDGSLATLADVVAFYDRGAVANPHLDPLIQPLRLSAGERADLVAFLEALTSNAAAAPSSPSRPGVATR